MTARERALEKALRCFVDAYPGGLWKGLLHEEGCAGVNWRLEEREEENPCRCDGDYCAEIVEQALATPKPPAKPKRKRKR